MEEKPLLEIAAQFTYTINEFDQIHRNDGGMINLQDHDNIAYILYQEWLKMGNTPTRIGPTFTYSRNEQGYLIRNEDNMIIKEVDYPYTLAYDLYKKWVASGNDPIPGGPIQTGVITKSMRSSVADPARYSYSYTPTNILMRNDGVFVPENEPDNIATILYHEWLDLGNDPPPLNDLGLLPPIDPEYKSPFSPNSPAYGPDKPDQGN